MRNENRRASPHHVTEMIQDLVFGVRIYAGKRIVQNQNAGIANQGAGYCGALLLSAGERDSALANQSFVLFGKLFDVSGYVRCLRRPANFHVAGLGHTESDVLANSFAEEKSLLRNETDVPTKIGQRIVPDGEAVNQNRSGFGIVDARNQADQRGLT